jgi:GNAT superfamily N-acetyltransferase
MTAFATRNTPDKPRSAPSPALEVRKGRAAEAQTVAKVLARAFHDDPVSAWVFPDPSRRPVQLERMHRDIFLPDAFRDDECYVTDDHGGVALWVPPESVRSSLTETLRLLPTAARIWGRGLPRALRVLAFIESNFPRESHAHLVFAGTEPEIQGRGIGSALLRETLARWDRERMPTYLEASSPRSRALYLRHGYVDLGRVDLPGGGPPLWRMWRDPA